MVTIRGARHRPTSSGRAELSTLSNFPAPPHQRKKLARRCAIKKLYQFIEQGQLSRNIIALLTLPKIENLVAEMSALVTHESKH